MLNVWKKILFLIFHFTSCLTFSPLQLLQKAWPQIPRLTVLHTAARLPDSSAVQPNLPVTFPAAVPFTGRGWNASNTTSLSGSSSAIKVSIFRTRDEKKLDENNRDWLELNRFLNFCFIFYPFHKKTDVVNPSLRGEVYLPVKDI